MYLCAGNPLWTPRKTFQTARVQFRNLYCSDGAHQIFNFLSTLLLQFFLLSVRGTTWAALKQVFWFISHPFYYYFFNNGQCDSVWVRGSSYTDHTYKRNGGYLILSVSVRHLTRILFIYHRIIYKYIFLGITEIFFSILFYSILFYSILFYSILFYFYSTSSLGKLILC